MTSNLNSLCNWGVGPSLQASNGVVFTSCSMGKSNITHGIVYYQNNQWHYLNDSFCSNSYSVSIIVKNGISTHFKDFIAKVWFGMSVWQMVSSH